MVVILMVSHVLRAERWKMLMKPTGHPITLTNSFLSLLIGYLINLAIPRGGEISRCYNLYKLDKSPVEISFGTVVVERAVDLICFVVIVIIAFLVESDKLFAFIESLPLSRSAGTEKILLLAVLALAALIIGTIGVVLIKRNERIRTKWMQLWGGFKTGLSGVFNLERKGLFIFYSIVIWVLYFLMTYTVILAFQETSHLGMSAVLSLFAIGSLAMVLPLPGGAGSYHTLVPAGMVFLYQIPRSQAVAFTFVFHGWQTMVMIVGGVLAFAVTYFIIHRRKPD
jgi:uncharacterized protein (TIRG00374 family)